MQAYIVKRVLLFIPTLIIVTSLVFILLRVVPGDPAAARLAGASGEADYTEEDRVALAKKLGTDRPLVNQYGTWVWGMLQGDFGNSFHYRTPVWDDLKRKFPVTIQLTIMALIMAVAVAVPLGVVSAIKQDGVFDYLGRLVTIAGIALPNFWIGIMVVFILANEFGYGIPLGYADFWEEPALNLEQLAFPALALAFSNMAFIARVTRSAVLEVFREDYIRTARSKGLTEFAVIGRHTLKNALLPVVTVAAYEFGRLMAGTVVIELIFNVPGMGRHLITSVGQRDFPVVQAIVMSITVIVLLLNLATDVIYGWLNPRIRYT